MENDILFSIAGALGKIAIVTKGILPANTNQALAIIRLNSPLVKHNYVLNYLKSDLIYLQFQKEKQGVAQLNLSLKNISELIIPLPSVEEQTAIVEILSAQDREIQLLETELELQKQKKKALMQLLLTGKVRVIP